MNIFMTDPDPQLSAEALDDKRLIKMVLETAQIVSTVVQGPYKVTHKNHPCVKWAGRTRGNFDWTCSHGILLGEEYSKRFAKAHKSHDVILLCVAGREGVPAGKLEAFVNCTHFQDMDTVYAYRHTLNNKWDEDKRPPKWTLRRPPKWARFRSTRVGDAFIYHQKGVSLGL